MEFQLHHYEVNWPGNHEPDEWRPIEPRWPHDETMCYDAEMAAERWCEANFARYDYPSEFDGLRVRRVDKPDEIETFDVEVRSVPEFTARKKGGG